MKCVIYNKKLKLFDKYISILHLGLVAKMKKLDYINQFFKRMNVKFIHQTIYNIKSHHYEPC